MGAVKKIRFVKSKDRPALVKAKPAANDNTLAASPKRIQAAIDRAVVAVDAAEEAEIERVNALHDLKRVLPQSTFVHPHTGVEMTVMIRGDKIFWRTKPRSNG